jgi:hypothetical protein
MDARSRKGARAPSSGSWRLPWGRGRFSPGNSRQNPSFEGGDAPVMRRE